MRSSKYHDYRVLKVALFIILVILGLFIYVKCIRPSFEHTAGEDAWVFSKEPTCTEDGMRHKVCTDCGEEFDYEVVPATGHTEGQWGVDKEVTCTENGSNSIKCTDCGEILKVKEVAALGHDVNTKWVTEKKPDCENEGLRYQACKVCGERVNEEVLPANGHKPGAAKEENRVESTCTVDGSYEKAEYCTVCKAEISREVIILPANGHKPGVAKEENRVESTCTVGGSFDMVEYCKVCNDVVSKNTVSLDLKPHSYGPETQEFVFNATHTVAGTYEAVFTCKDCGHEDRMPKIINPIGHAYSWELKYDAETGEFTMVGTCDCDEEGNVVIKGASDGLVIAFDTTVPSCCLKRYIGTITIDGVTIERTIVVESDVHKIHKTETLDQETGEMVIFYIPITDYAKWDDEYGWYYDLSLLGLGYYETDNNVWDENGFALGAYKCVYCEDKLCSECNGQYWYVVRVYSPEYDTRLTK